MRADVWTDDSTAQCERCAAYFTLIKRRHHCRACGKIVCQKCSSREMVLKGTPYVGPVRVCDGCYKVNRAGSGNNLLEIEDTVSSITGSPIRTSLKSPPVSPLKVSTPIKSKIDVLDEVNGGGNDNGDGCCVSCFSL